MDETITMSKKEISRLEIMQRIEQKTLKQSEVDGRVCSFFERTIHISLSPSLRGGDGISLLSSQAC